MADPIGTHAVRTRDGRMLECCEWGDPDGRPLVYLHGAPGSRLLRAVDGRYERNALRVITYDRPGYGGSTRQPGRTVGDTGRDVECIVESLGIERFAVVGVSAGGPHALAVAARLPERVVRCATVVGLGPYDGEGLDFLAGMNPDDVAELRGYASGVRPDEATVLREIRAWAEGLHPGNGPETYALGVLVEAVVEALRPGAGGHVDDTAALTRPWGFDLAEVVCPVLLLVAEDDTSAPPAHGRWLAGRLRDARLVTVPGGHLDVPAADEERVLAWAAEPLTAP